MWYKILWEFREGRSNLWLGAREGFTEVVEFLVGIPVGWELGIACGRQTIYREEKSLEFKVERINYEDFPSGTVLKTLYFQCRVTGLIPCQRTIWAFPDSSVGKESAWNAGDPRLIRRLGRSAGEGIGYPLQYSCLESPHGQRSLVGYSPWLFTSPHAKCHRGHRVRHNWSDLACTQSQGRALHFSTLS